MKPLTDWTWGDELRDYEDFFRLFGVAFHDARGNLKSVYAIFKEAADNLKKMEEGAADHEQ